MSKDECLNLICRLCGREEMYLIDIFSEEGRKQNLEKKIRLCLPIIVTLDDHMPRQVCLDCLNKLDAAFDLYTGCVDAQYHIRAKLGSTARQPPGAAINGALESGFLYDKDKIHGKAPGDNSLRSVLGLHRTFSSYVDIEQKRLEEENMKTVLGCQRGVVQTPGIQVQNSTQYVNNMTAQINSSASSGPLLGVQLDRTGHMMSAPNVAIMQANNSPVTGNPQNQLYVTSLANSMNTTVPVAPAAVPVLGSPQNTMGSSVLQCNQTMYQAQNNLPSSLQIMPVAQPRAVSSDRPSAQFAAAAAVFQAQQSSAHQNGVQLTQPMGHESQMQQPSKDSVFSRLLSETQAPTPVNSGMPSVIPTTTFSSNLFSNIPSPTSSMPVISTPKNNNITQVHSSVGKLTQQQHHQLGSFMQETVSLWLDKQNALKTPVGSTQSVDGSQMASISDLSALRVGYTNHQIATSENGSASTQRQPLITQVTSGFQNAGRPVQLQQDAATHLDLSQDSDDDMDVTPAPEASDMTDTENVKPFVLSVPTQRQPPKRAQRKKNANPSSMETCPHCHKEFRADIIFHHIKLHFRQSFFSCLDCGKNYSSEKALESHNCPGEVA